MALANRTMAAKTSASLRTKKIFLSMFASLGDPASALQARFHHIRVDQQAGLNTPAGSTPAMKRETKEINASVVQQKIPLYQETQRRPATRYRYRWRTGNDRFL